MTVTLSELYSAIKLPTEVVNLVNAVNLCDKKEKIEELKLRLCTPEGYEKAAAELNEILQPDPDGMKILRVMLETALLSHDKYAQMGIRGEIFDDTMGCFTRFIGETLVSTGKYCFDRWWWTGRQLSLSLFRIGTLEYEITEGYGVPEISVHIPSDADMTDAAIGGSLSAAKSFFRDFDGGKHDGLRYTCTSWLLSPALDRLLPESSKILHFKRRFEIVETDPDNDGYKFWVYNNSNLAPEEFPEKTSLQRNMKRFVLNGGKVGEARGILK